jgi:hypothetical protein
VMKGSDNAAAEIYRARQKRGISRVLRLNYL